MVREAGAVSGNAVASHGGFLTLGRLFVGPSGGLPPLTAVWQSLSTAQRTQRRSQLTTLQDPVLFLAGSSSNPFEHDSSIRQGSTGTYLCLNSAPVVDENPELRSQKSSNLAGVLHDKPEHRVAGNSGATGAFPSRGMTRSPRRCTLALPTARVSQLSPRGGTPFPSSFRRLA